MNRQIASYRCKVCHTPIRGLMSLPYRVRGILPFSKNPDLCNRCSKADFPPVDREITTFVADVRGFTTMSERESPRRVREQINVFFAAACDLLVENNALVDKFLGDAVMAFFNAPIPLPNHREVALQTAIRLQRKLRTLQLPFSIGIGLDTGLALTGNVGGSTVTDYTALGDAVNVASRLSGLAKGGEILAGEATLTSPRDQIPADCSYEHLALNVKGKEQVVHAYRIYDLDARSK